MSNEAEGNNELQDQTVALFLANHDGDELTDILVAALNDTLRILGDEAASETVH